MFLPERLLLQIIVTTGGCEQFLMIVGSAPRYRRWPSRPKTT
ncbi:MAG TPA: hypothetical protein PLQ74_00835 [Pseudomonadota bacterium]|nr:hypothetical protein [Pseudomonadota bacterium]